MKNGFVRVACGTPKLKLANCEYNAEQTIDLIKAADKEQVSLLILPELGITGYTCGDLFNQETLLRSALDALGKILDSTKGTEIITAVGVPIGVYGRLYNCAAVIQNGKILGIVPKTNIPNYGEFYEKRHFSPAKKKIEYLTVCGQADVPFGPGIVFECEDLRSFRFGIELCEDLWVPESPSLDMCAAGATIIGNLSASNEIVGKDEYRRQLVAAQSAKLICGYIYADAGEGESTSDLVFCSHNFIVENGVILEDDRFDGGLTMTEIDVEKLEYDRRRTQMYFEHGAGEHLFVPFNITLRDLELTRYYAPNPFIPENDTERDKRCNDIVRIASLGLKRRIEHTWCKKAVIGLSGGLDSTLAALIIRNTLDMMGRPHEDMLAITMPCYGTTSRTKDNAVILAEELGAEIRTIDIQASVDLHLKDIGHDDSLQNNAYENAQARERTQILMDVANDVGGMVIGTGDLSELALGWCTYNGDHMSMYGVNGSIPKTLIRYVVDYIAREELKKGNQKLGECLLDILGTPVSPELLPASEGEIVQKTEDIIGPYELHDFFLYYVMRWGFSPLKVYRLACYALKGKYDPETIAKWIKVFYKRFFTQQFKRNCLPDGPKVGSVALSPRGDWRMPSDADRAIWDKELEQI